MKMLIKKKRIPVKQILLIGFLPSFIKKYIYRLKGYRIGPDVKIGIGTVIIGKEVIIGKGTKIGFLTIFYANEIKIDRFVQIGSFCYFEVHKLNIGDDTRIKENVFVTGYSSEESQLLIGKRVIIMQYSFLNSANPIIMEDDVAIGGLGCIFTHSSWQSILEGYPVRFSPVTIRKNVWVAWRCFIFPGVEIGANSTIGADSSVTADIPPNSLASGSPAKVVLTGDKFWPRRISNKAKERIMDDINLEFCKYLNYNGFQTNKEDYKKYSIIKISDIDGRIIFSLNGEETVNLKSNDVYVSLFKNINPSGLCMELNIMQKRRIGSNPLGEEYTRFLSRYGIRFERID